jgi:hypothetical protein
MMVERIEWNAFRDDAISGLHGFFTQGDIAAERRLPNV